MKNKKSVIALTLLIFAAAAIIVLETVNIPFTEDSVLNGILKNVLSRLFAGGAVVAVAVFAGYAAFLKPEKGVTGKNLIWCLPCLSVAVVNFPFYAVISGAAQITRPDLIPLFVAECITTALFEEFTFRGIILGGIDDYLGKRRYGALVAVVLSSAVFALMHLFNLFSGAGVGATFLQVGYTFLIGCMLAAVFLRTKNIWLCVILHAVFNFGGLIIPEIGAGAFQDTCFWILTAVAGLSCSGHILCWLLKKK